MSAEILMGGGDSELLVDLKSSGNFEEMKLELDISLQNVSHYLLGSPINIDIGSKRLTEKQLRELEDVMLTHGMHLRNIITSRNLTGAGDSVPINKTGGVAASGDTVLICQHLRSGQRYLARGNMVILGDVNPGAEVVAGGSILVMGALKGMAHAGALGNEDAVIAACRLSPTQLRIANYITRSPDGKAIPVTTPELARVWAGRIFIEKLKI